MVAKFMVMVAVLHQKRSGWCSVQWNYSSPFAIKNICVFAFNPLMLFCLLPVCQNDLQIMVSHNGDPWSNSLGKTWACSEQAFQEILTMMVL